MERVDYVTVTGPKVGEQRGAESNEVKHHLDETAESKTKKKSTDKR